MSDSRIGDYVLQHRYRVDPSDRAVLLDLLAKIRAYAFDLGVAQFEVWQDDVDPWVVTEIHGYDSWSQYARLSQKHLPAHMEATYADLTRLIEGGLDSIQTTTWNAVDLPDFED